MKLITWNIQWGRGIDGRVDLARIVATVRSMADFDVLCLQEVADNFPDLPGNDDADQFAVLARLLPDYAALEGVAVDVRGEALRRRRFGNLILSRLPVHAVRRHALPWPADPQKDSMPRVAIEAVLQAPFGPLRVTTTHLEYYSDRQRFAQARRLRELHDEACGRAAATPLDQRQESNATFERTPQALDAILTGDFNFPPEAPEYLEIQAPLAGGGPRYRDAWTHVHGEQPHDPTFCVHERSWKDTPYCCDFMFASEAVLARVKAISVDAATRDSDHQPVRIDFEG